MRRVRLAESFTPRDLIWGSSPPTPPFLSSLRAVHFPQYCRLHLLPYWILSLLVLVLVPPPGSVLLEPLQSGPAEMGGSWRLTNNGTEKAPSWAPQTVLDSVSSSGLAGMQSCTHREGNGLREGVKGVQHHTLGGYKAQALFIWGEREHTAFKGGNPKEAPTTPTPWPLALTLNQDGHQENEEDKRDKKLQETEAESATALCISGRGRAEGPVSWSPGQECLPFTPFLRWLLKPPIPYLTTFSRCGVVQAPFQLSSGSRRSSLNGKTRQQWLQLSLGLAFWEPGPLVLPFSICCHTTVIWFFIVRNIVHPTVLPAAFLLVFFLLFLLFLLS